MTRVLRLDRVGKRHRRRWVLRDVAAEAAAGTTTLVRGSNGAGKSTLLRIAAGVSGPSAGRRAVPAGLRVGWAPDGLDSPPALTVAAYLRHHERIRAVAGPARRAGAPAARDDVAGRLGLDPFRDVLLPDLSQGTLRRVVLAQALLAAPGLLVLDEPFSGLDPDGRTTVAAVLAERAAAGAAVVVAEHDAGALAADVVWHVRGGGLAVVPA